MMININSKPRSSVTGLNRGFIVRVPFYTSDMLVKQTYLEPPKT